jgi:hypothetical protein
VVCNPYPDRADIKTGKKDCVTSKTITLNSIF